MNAIIAEGLGKTFGSGDKAVEAVVGIDLTVDQGTVVGLLGPNGAGKTTTVRMLTTLLTPDRGTATVAGHDVVREAQQVRSSIGLSGQYAAVDETLTGRENLWLFGRLYQLSSKDASRRADELLEQFGLVDAANRTLKTYSGGMRRRLDLASSLIVHPQILFLDEPTTGLDPSSRADLWAVIRERKNEGATILLTTQYLEEADELADEIVVIDHGGIIAQGTADRLKSQVGGERLEVVMRDDADLDKADAILSHNGSVETFVETPLRQVVVPTTEGAQGLIRAIRELDAAGIEIADIGLRRPTLDDVFMSLTGHYADNGSTSDGPAHAATSEGNAA